jgi:hypothetical protein
MGPELPGKGLGAIERQSSLRMNPGICCYVNLRLIKKIQDEEKDNKKATRVDPDSQWEDFFEAALIDGLLDERERSRKIKSERIGRWSQSQVMTMTTTTSTKLLDPSHIKYYVYSRNNDATLCHPTDPAGSAGCC